MRKSFMSSWGLKPKVSGPAVGGVGAFMEGVLPE
jgi:hypothetical protein